jgi:hypothetical protein
MAGQHHVFGVVRQSKAIHAEHFEIEFDIPAGKQEMPPTEKSNQFMEVSQRKIAAWFVPKGEVTNVIKLRGRKGDSADPITEPRMQACGLGVENQSATITKAEK